MLLCPSVTSRCSIKTVKHIIQQTISDYSSEILNSLHTQHLNEYILGSPTTASPNTGWVGYKVGSLQPVYRYILHPGMVQLGSPNVTQKWPTMRPESPFILGSKVKKKLCRRGLLHALL